MTIGDKNLCPNCFYEIADTETPCPACGYTEGVARPYPSALPLGSILMGRYIIGKVLGKGGFGITYLAYDAKDYKKVAIKEYLPDSLIHRSVGDTSVSMATDGNDGAFQKGAERFYEEAQTISRFNGNPGLVSVFEFFYENNTAYFAMEYLEGIDLKRYIAQYGGAISEEKTLEIAKPLIDSLIIVHSIGVLHRDISPDNVYMTNDGQIKLIDFGAARQVIGEVSKSLSVILKQGFAPIEQYQTKGKQGSWTDIYALGATMYYCLTGKTPDAPMDRLEEDNLIMPQNISQNLQTVLTKMLSVRAADRYQDVIELKRDMQAYGLLPNITVNDPAKATAIPSSYSAVPAHEQTPHAPVPPSDYTPVQTPTPNFPVNSGYSQEQQPQPHPQAAAIPIMTPAEPYIPAKSNKKLIVTIIAAGFVVILGLVVFLIANNRSSSNNIPMNTMGGGGINSAPVVPPTTTPASQSQQFNILYNVHDTIDRGDYAWLDGTDETREYILKRDDTDWMSVIGADYKVTDPDIKYCTAGITVSNLGSCTAYVSYVVILEHDSSGNETVLYDSNEDPLFSYFRLWSEDGSGSSRFIRNDNMFEVTGTTSAATLSIGAFEVKQGYSYSVHLVTRHSGSGFSNDTVICPNIAFFG